MNITFRNPGIDAMIESVLSFQLDGESAYWVDGLYAFYPMIDRARARSLRWEERRDYIGETLRQEYKSIGPQLEEKIVLYGECWTAHRAQVTAALSDAFEIDCRPLFNDLVCDVSMNPISPRFLKERRFEVFYLNSPRGAIGMSLHEIIHFLWFHVWHELFRDSYGEYERPALKWILSEMVVESIMSDERLASINPYFPRENGGCVYAYFYDMMVDGHPALDCLAEMYQRLNIRAFMRESYEWIRAHEPEIRSHIDASEARGIRREEE